ncbi:unnamed protein product [Linum tenue]|uniref:Uncharacterized protein n=1 Tax=Linum tenue TaxID=586396 RepID=A0AAV0RIF1_9ROSI|nr:unnamed protein product [Linum tenue]
MCHRKVRLCQHSLPQQFWQRPDPRAQPGRPLQSGFQRLPGDQHRDPRLPEERNQSNALLGRWHWELL